MPDLCQLLPSSRKPAVDACQPSWRKKGEMPVRRQLAWFEPENHPVFTPSIAGLFLCRANAAPGRFKHFWCTSSLGQDLTPLARGHRGGRTRPEWEYRLLLKGQRIDVD